MITFLSGGTGTPKLLLGMRDLLSDAMTTVVVNTAEDIWMNGGHISPDVDTVLYLFAGTLNTATWWGVAGDTFSTHEALIRLGTDEYIAIGDRDRAIHLARARLLESGSSLTAATSAIAARLGVRAQVLPMTDEAVATMVTTPDGPLHFQEYWVRQKGSVPLLGVSWTPIEPPPATPEVLAAIRGADAVIIGPSNPVTSILPILRCRGVREALAERPVIAISPFIGDAPVSGPAGALMRAIGAEPGSLGTAALYGETVRLFVQDIRDPAQVPGSVRLDTIMKGREESRALAHALLGLMRDLGCAIPI
ncbi:MAG: 2-phospho-L-lactate transferase [Methanomicrobiales archaeon]|nr:2-phospho-L-lactate transferase [Methanomicrobiales archaeon]